MVEDALGKFGGYWLDFDFDYILNKRADIHILFDLSIDILVYLEKE